MRLGGMVVVILAALALTTALAGETPGRSSTPGTQEQEQPSSLGSMSRYLGLTVNVINFPGVKEASRLTQIIEQKAGQPLDRDRIRRSIQTLHGTGRFADIQVEAERTADNQVSLTFLTAPNYFVGEVSVEGGPSRPTPNQVVNATKFQLGELFTREKLERALKNIQQLMEENGYYKSSAREEEQKHPETQQVDLLFRLTPGPQAHVGTVEVTGHPGYSQGQIQDIVKMHSADMVSAERATRALERLRKKYQKQDRLLAQVSVEHSYRPELNAVDYIFHVEPGPTVEIGVEGFKISHGVLKRNVPVYEENALDDDLINEGRRNLLNYLQTRGYFDAKVGIRKQSDPAKNELRVTYVMDEGPRHKLVKVEVSGNNSFSEDQIRSRMQVQPAGRLLSHGRYSQGLLNDDVRNIEDNPYRYNGFQQVKITPKVEDDYQGKENQLAVTLQIEEGPLTVVSELHLVGNHTISAGQLQPLLNTEPGQGYSESKIAADREIILNYYFNHGFPDASFEASAIPTPGQANRMDVTFAIREGEQIFVNQLFVSGLDHTRSFVVQRELQVKSGDPVSQIEMLNTQKSLYDLGLFSQVDTAVQNPDGDEQEKNVLVQVQEAKRYTFNYGLGLEFQTGQPAIGTNQPQGETGVSPRVSFDVTRLNFRGRNHTLTFKTHVGRLQQRALISYDAPRWFNSRDWRLSFTTFYDNTLDVTTFTSQRLEGSVGAEQTITRAANGQPVSTLLYRFTYRRVRASNLVVDINSVPTLSRPVRVGFPGFSYIRDKRDNALETTKGNYTTLDGGVADSHFGSEADFSRLLIQNATYQPFGKKRRTERKFVFARSTRIGLESPFGSTFIPPPGQQCPHPGQTSCPGTSVIPLPERFLSGGGNSHRGFGLNQAGPRDPTTGFPLGGSALFLNNLELRFPPVSLPYLDENISFTIFHDMGNVFTDGNDLVHSLLRWRQRNPQLCLQQSTATQCDYNYLSHAIGIGVRYRTPIGPVRFDFGYNLNPPAFPSCQTDPKNPTAPCGIFVPQHGRHFNVFFSIGQTF